MRFSVFGSGATPRVADRFPRFRLHFITLVRKIVGVALATRGYQNTHPSGKRAKGDIERIVPIPEVVFTELLAYLHERKGRTGPLFVTEAKRRPIAQRLVGEAVHAAAVRAGITRRVTPKTLRHSFATHLMDRGVDLAVISKLMGHSSPTESGVYLHVLPGRQQEAVDCLEEEEQPTNEQEDENREDEP